MFVKKIEFLGHFAKIQFEEFTPEVRRFISNLFFLRTSIPINMDVYAEFLLYKVLDRDKSLRIPRGLVKLGCTHRLNKDNPVAQEILNKIRFKDIEIRDDYWIDRVTILGEERINVSSLGLWDVQKEALTSILKELSKFGGTTLHAVTGSGKTNIAIAVHIAVNHGKPEAERRANKTFFITLSKFLVDQAVKRFRKFGIYATPFHGEKQDLSGEVICVTAQSIYSSLKRTGKLIEIYGRRGAPLIARAIEKWIGELLEEGISDEKIPEIPKESMDNLLVQLSNANLVVFDECHHVSCELAQASIIVAKNAFTLGLSATPWRNDDRDLEIYAMVGAINDYRITNKMMIKRKKLVPAIIIFFHIDYTRDEVAEVLRKVYEAKRRKRWHVANKLILYHPKRIKRIAEIAKLLPEPILLLVKEIAQGKILSEQIPSSYFAFGETDMETRNRRIAQLMGGYYRVLIATSIADEGLDIPNLLSLIQAQGGKSKTRAFQRVGRVVRIAPDKKFGIVVDIWDERMIYFHDHAKERERLYRMEEKKSPEDVGWEIYHVHSIKALEELLRKLGVL